MEVGGCNTEEGDYAQRETSLVQKPFKVESDG